MKCVSRCITSSENDMDDSYCPSDGLTEEEMSDIINKYREHYEYQTRYVYFRIQSKMRLAVEQILMEKRYS
jgi:hypothetical protein